MTSNNNIEVFNPMSNVQNFAEQAQEDFSAASKAGFDKTVSAINNSVSVASAGFEKTQAQVKQNMEKMMRTAEELIAFSQGNYEAVVKSTQIWAAGLQDLSKQMASSAQAQFEDNVTAMRSLGGVKSVKDMFDAQSSMARAAMEKTMSETGRLTDASIKLTEQALAPLTARVNLAVEKFTRSA